MNTPTKDANTPHQNVVIIDTGCANISSVRIAIERLGCAVTISREADVILSADKVFLPGVGTAAAAMHNLRERDLIDLIKRINKPVLGICLGMQLLGLKSFEDGAKTGTKRDGGLDCLGLCNSTVEKMQTGDLPLPHMGWNTIAPVPNHPLFTGIDKNAHFYFVHSYAMPVCDATIATCDYGGDFTAAVQNNNFYGVQFHPERSSTAGAQLIANFLNL